MSLIFLAVTVAAWLGTARDLRPRWWLIPLTWVWATAHGFWSIGVLLGVVSCCGLCLDRRFTRGAGVKLLAVPVLSVVAACLTPVGPRLLATQLAVSARSGFIGEWGSTSFRDMAAVVVGGMLATLLVLWARRGGVPWTSILLLLLACALTVYAVRTVALGAVIAAPLLAGALQQAIGSPARRPGRSEILALAAATVTCAGLLAVAVPHTADKPDNVPEGLAPELSNLPRDSAVMVDGTVGSWLEWRFPGLNPTMDGMFDAYTLDYMRSYQAARDLEPGWQDFVERTGARAAVLRREGPLASAMVDSLGWREVARDDPWVLLVAPRR